MWLVYKLHALAIAAAWWLLRLAGRSVWSFVLAVIALLGVEFRRWAGLAVWGVLIVLAGKLALHAPMGRQPLLLTVLLVLGLWALAVRRAAHVTRENNLVKVRQQQAFRELRGDVKDVRRSVGDGIANVTWGTPVERLSKRNRDRGDREAAEEARAARAEAAAERERMDEERKVMAERAAGYDPDDGF